MVSLSIVKASNARIASTLPVGVVAVFTGATSGIGETTVREFARSTAGLKPRVYLIGRNQQAAERIIAECRQLNPSGSFEFLHGDLRLLSEVDKVCNEIKRREETINILFMSAGRPTLDHSLTSEGLHEFSALIFYSRFRMLINLLPLIRLAANLRRVVVIRGGGYEGPLYPDDFPAVNVPLLSIRGHLCTLITLALEGVARTAPDVSFINDFPGAVDTPFSSHVKGILGVVLRMYFFLFGWLICVPIVECGERHVYFATSKRYPAKEAGPGGGIPVEGVEVARGSDGEVGSGVYSLDWDGESASPKVWKLLSQYREEGMVDRIWAHVNREFAKISRQDSN